MPSAPDLAARRAAAEAGNVRVLSQFVDQAIQVYTQGPSSTQELQSFRAQSARVAIMDGAANQDVEAFHIEWVETMKRLHAHLSGKPLEQVIAVLGKNWERGITDWLCAHEPGTLPHTDPIFKSLWGDERRPRIHPVGSRHGLMGRLAPGQRELLAHTIEPAFREAVAWTLEGAPLARLAGLPVHDERTRARKWGIDDLDRVYDLEELAKGDVIFAATGVTDGSLLEGVKRKRGGIITTESIVMRASSRTVRRVKSEHRLKD